MASTSQNLDRGHYPGGKNAAGVWQWIIENMPTHAGYCEPFVGSGAVLRRKIPALTSLAMDIDPTVVRWWKQRQWPGLQFRRSCGIRWLEQVGTTLDDDWLIYCDPPYPHATRNQGKLKVYYREWTDGMHADFLDIVRSLRCLVMISTYTNRPYHSALSGWHRQTRWAMTRGGKRQEVLYTNFAPAAAVAAGHVVVGECARVSGATWRERERIGRKQRRWQSNYRRLPRHERRAILAGLLIEEQRMKEGGHHE